MLREAVAETTRHIGEQAEEEDREAPTGRNIIVAIGINAYRHHPHLDNPINDAQAVLTLFEQCGFEELPGVPSLIADNATREAIANLPERLAAALHPDDNLVVFFAGHGEKRERQAPDPAEPGKTYTHRTGYLIPVDGPKNKPGDWIKLDGFLNDLSGLPARHIFVILDACKSGIALADKFKTRGGEQPTSIKALRKLPSRRVMTSALHNERAAEGGGGAGHSVFAEALIEAIQDRQADKDGDGYVKTVDLFSFMQDRVSDRANKLFKLKQTPDYGYLPGDGSGDLVISLREGAFNRLIQAALDAMLRHDVPGLDELVTQLVAANPEYPVTLYLQFRLKFMQGDIPAAAEIVSRLHELDLPPGTLPLSAYDLNALSVQLDYWEPVLLLPSTELPMEIEILTGQAAGDLHPAPVTRCPAGPAYQVENHALAQFQVTNLSGAPMYLYYVAVVPTGRLVIGSLLDPDHLDGGGLPPQTSGVGHSFYVRGLPGSVTETRILFSPTMIWGLLAPPTVGARAVETLDPSLLEQVRMQSIWYQIPEDSLAGPTDVEAILSAFVW